MVAFEDREARQERELRLAAHQCVAQILLWVVLGFTIAILLLASARTEPRADVLLIFATALALSGRQIRTAYYQYRRKIQEADRVARRRAARLPQK